MSTRIGSCGIVPSLQVTLLCSHRTLLCIMFTSHRVYSACADKITSDSLFLIQAKSNLNLVLLMKLLYHFSVYSSLICWNTLIILFTWQSSTFAWLQSAQCPRPCQDLAGIETAFWWERSTPWTGEVRLHPANADGETLKYIWSKTSGPPDSYSQQHWALPTKTKE